MLAGLNNGPADKKRDLGVTEFDFGSKLEHDLCLDPAVTYDHMKTKRSYPGGRIIRRQSTALTPGYVTSDDFGTDGDDTAHSKIPNYSQPEYFEGNASFPANGSLPATVDLIFLDYIAADVLAVLTGLGLSYTLADVNYYLPKVSRSSCGALHCDTDWQQTFTTNSYLPIYAKQAWQANVPNCPVGLGVGYNDTASA